MVYVQHTLMVNQKMVNMMNRALAMTGCQRAPNGRSRIKTSEAWDVASLVGGDGGVPTLPRYASLEGFQRVILDQLDVGFRAT